MQAGRDYGVRIVRPYGQFSVGRVLFPDGVIRQFLLKNGFAEVVRQPQAPKAKAKEAKRER